MRATRNVLWNLQSVGIRLRLATLFCVTCVRFAENTIRAVLVCALQEGSSILLVNGRLNERPIRGVLIDFGTERHKGLCCLN